MNWVTQAVFSVIFLGLILTAAAGLVEVFAPGALRLAWQYVSNTGDRPE